MIRRRPIPRSRDYPAESLRYTTILSGAVRVYPDGREVCQDCKAGWLEYKRRVKVMVERQGRRCCLCKKPLALGNATFEHQRRRGMGAAWRDDRIEKDGQPWNGAAHWVCNSEKGSSITRSACLILMGACVFGIFGSVYSPTVAALGWTVVCLLCFGLLVRGERKK